MFFMTPFLGSRQDKAAFASKAKHPSLNHAFQLKAIFLHLTCLYCMKHHQGKMQGKLELQSMLQITSQTSETIAFQITFAEKGNGLEDEKDWECCDP